MTAGIAVVVFNINSARFAGDFTQTFTALLPARENRKAV
jgi:hypothetical protein